MLQEESPNPMSISIDSIAEVAVEAGRIMTSALCRARGVKEIPECF